MLFIKLMVILLHIPYSQKIGEKLNLEDCCIYVCTTKFNTNINFCVVSGVYVLLEKEDKTKWKLLYSNIFKKN